MVLQASRNDTAASRNAIVSHSATSTGTASPSVIARRSVRRASTASGEAGRGSRLRRRAVSVLSKRAVGPALAGALPGWRCRRRCERAKGVNDVGRLE